MHLRVATYNIHRAIGGDGIASIGRIAGILGDLDADITALQEVAFAADLHRPGNLLNTLALAVGADVIAGPTLLEERGCYGNALLTRLPPVRLKRLSLGVPGREPRGALAVTFDIDGTAVKVIATHLGLFPGERRRQIRRIMALADQPPAAVTILMGDFNEWFRWALPLRLLYRTFGVHPAPLTFPSFRPLLALDRIWVRPADRLQTVHAHRAAPAGVASDHLPLVATVAI